MCLEGFCCCNRRQLGNSQTSEMHWYLIVQTAGRSLSDEAPYTSQEVQSGHILCGNSCVSHVDICHVGTSLCPMWIYAVWGHHCVPCGYMLCGDGAVSHEEYSVGVYILYPMWRKSVVV